MKLQILQLKKTPELHNYYFSSLDFLKKFNMSVDINNYNIVYSSNEIDDDYDNIYKVLETIFIRFQGHKPEGYTGHSLSVSDIILLGNDYWYCDDYGFKKLTFK